MIGMRNQTLLFGIDLSPLWRDLVAAWRGMRAWPVFAWLGPKLPVRLWLATGHAVFSRGPGTPYREGGRQLDRAAFNAILLPEHMLLRCVVKLPHLQSQDLLAALALQVAGLSPFPADELVWTHEREFHKNLPSDSTSIHLTLASRRLIRSYVLQNYPNLTADTAEVWLPSALTPFYLLLPGFGEAARLKKTAIWGWVSAFLVVVALTLLVAMAITPTAQLYLRVYQAQAAMTALQKVAAPVLQQREALVHTTDQLVKLAELAGNPIPPLETLRLITDALPDDTFVVSLQIQGRKVTLTGQTTNASTLMKQLGSTPGLRDVIAPTPATKPLGAPRESFTIEFTLDAAPLKPTATLPAQ